MSKILIINFKFLFIIFSALVINFLSVGCKNTNIKFEVYETSKSGNKLTLIKDFELTGQTSEIVLNYDDEFQTITGFGGAFTESSAYLLNQLSQAKKFEVLKSYFSKEAASYSLTRTHMNSCDFSLQNYSYTPVSGDENLDYFSINEDLDDLIPMIKDAIKISEEGFKILASPWTAAPWMKDNNSWVGGKLLPKYYDTWASFFLKYLDAYEAQGINIWGFTVENEPLGNGNNWDSMHFSPKEMDNFVQNYLGPKLEVEGRSEIVILGYDQNRADLKEWVDVMYNKNKSVNYFDGTAIHWYESTYDYFPNELQYAHQMAKDKYLIQTEACIDSEVPVWENDSWYWEKKATDWGYDWREESKKYLHPKYAPANRYARDIIGCLNNWVDGWVDWNMVLDRQGGPNWFKNWCIAPIIVDTKTDQIYYTPLYYIMSHFSKFIRPGAKVIGTSVSDENLMATAAVNPDSSTTVVVFNEQNKPKTFILRGSGFEKKIGISAQSIQTIQFHK